MIHSQVVSSEQSAENALNTVKLQRLNDSVLSQQDHHSITDSQSVRKH